MGLRILITNIELRSRSGSTLYVYDLALELKRQGHFPAVYTLGKGAVARELENAGIPVADNLRRLAIQPEIIHGHHFPTTLSAVEYFPGVPAIYICHAHDVMVDRAHLHRRIRRYFGVSRVCLEALIKDGVPPDQVQWLPNFVDLGRFRPRPPLPDHPRRALVFSNYAKADNYLPAVIEVCRQADLQLDVVGAGVGNAVDHPEDLLGNYDIVFAKAKAAMEAMAVGTAVILCDTSGVGPMVTALEFNALRPMNFGFQALREAIKPETILRQIARYNAQDAAKVRDLIRADAGLDQAVQNLVGIYRTVIEEQQRDLPALPEKIVVRRMLRYRFLLNFLTTWHQLDPSHRTFLKKLPGVMPVWHKVKAKWIMR